MMKENKVFVKREFEIFSVNTETSLGNMTIKVFIPYQSQIDWVCQYQILGVDTNIKQLIHGIDSFQALTNTIKVIGGEIDGLKRKFIIRYLGSEDLWI